MFARWRPRGRVVFASRQRHARGTITGLPRPPGHASFRAVSERIFSGMQPTGELHFGNYFGALANWVSLSKDIESIFCIVDQHAFTIDYDPKDLPAKVVDMATGYLAAGVDPERSIIFVQSDVPEHTELAWYLSTVTQFGELARMTQFKDKAEHHTHNINAGLFTYPVLMAADILLYKATLVPVGEDQVQHLEIARDIAHRFNTRFGETFPLPKARLGTAARIMGTDGLRKMSKSLGNYIGMLEEDKAIWKKLRSAFTDPQRQVREDPGRPEICNIYRMHTAVTAQSQLAEVEVKCRTAGFGCGDCKKLLAENLTTTLSPIRERARELKSKPGYVREVLDAGAKRARAIARETIREVRARMGMQRDAAGLAQGS
jgi:tryptophanyl-tRNA synthetase